MTFAAMLIGALEKKCWFIKITIREKRETDFYANFCRIGILLVLVNLERWRFRPTVVRRPFRQVNRKYARERFRHRRRRSTTLACDDRRYRRRTDLSIRNSDPNHRRRRRANRSAAVRRDRGPPIVDYCKRRMTAAAAVQLYRPPIARHLKNVLVQKYSRFGLKPTKMLTRASRSRARSRRGRNNSSFFYRRRRRLLFPKQCY